MRPTKMMRICGVGISSERKKLISALTKLGCVQVTACGEIDGTLKVSEDNTVDTASIKLARLAFARQFVKEHIAISKRKASKPSKTLEYARNEDGEVVKIKKPEPIIPYKPTKKPLIAPKPQIDYDRFSVADEEEKPIFDLIAKLEEYNQQLLVIKTEELKSRTTIEQIRPFLNLTLKLSKYRDTGTCSVMVGTIVRSKVELLDNIREAYPNVVFEVLTNILKKQNKTIAIAAVCLKEYGAAIAEELSKLDFVAFSQAYSYTAKTIFDNEIVNIKLARARRDEISLSIATEYDNLKFLADTRLMEDFYNVKLQMLKAESDMRATKAAFVFEGWIPDNCVDIVTAKLEHSDMAMAFFMRDYEDGEIPPTYLQDNPIVTPYQSITNMFSAPSYNEINPNPFVAFFYILFFGVMISDAGYGVIMVIATSIILAVAKPRRNEMSMVKILFMGGISTIFWGIMFGGYFGIDVAITHIPPVMFNPINEPMSMLFLSLGLGLTQMLTGMAINAYSLFRQKKPLDAIFGVFSWYVLVIGVAMLFIKPIPMIVGVIVAVVGVAGLMVGGALHKKGAKCVGGAFGKLYGLINFFSDLMSYTRLFGLGLATSVIAMVFNQLAGIIVDINLYIGILIAPVILVVGHVFNMFINTLGAYVHNSRLQFVEFFGRFYTGGGSLFHPLGSNMRYYNFVLEDTANVDKPNKMKKRAQQISK